MKKFIFKALIGGISLATINVSSIYGADPQDPIPSAIQVNTETSPESSATSAEGTSSKGPTINFNNVSIIEYIRFLSKLSNKNFVFDDAELQFNVTIVSEQPTTVENLMAALLQELLIHNLLLTEQGNTVLIHQNPKVRSPGKIVADGLVSYGKETEIVTRVFRLNTLDPNKISEVIRTLVSTDALVEVLQNTNTLIITDLTNNVNKIAQLITSLDSPNSGMQIGHYIIKNGIAETAVALAEQILQPIAQGNPFVLIPQTSTNSVFIVSNGFLVERAIAIFEYIDSNDARTKILNLEQLKHQEEEAAARFAREGREAQGEGAAERAKNTAGRGGQGSIFHPGELSSTSRFSRDLPAGHIEKTMFYIYKLRYRKGDQIQTSLLKIAESLQTSGSTNADLIAVINSAQWIESTNSLIFTGTVSALNRISDLLEEIDTPLRQVFIEVLVLDTTLSDGLEYGVDWGSRFGGGNTSGSQAFLSPTSVLPGSLDSSGPGLFPNANPLARVEGFNLGVIGQQITHGGMHFATISALVHALHRDTKTNILMNPKIITEDNSPAEIFVGETSRYKTQSIANDQGTILTNNFQFIDVGTTLRVTPLIGNNNIITLEIYQEITNETPNANPQLNSNNSANTTDVNLVPVTSKTRTTTKVHVPDKYFVVLSGMIMDTRLRNVTQIPCLGGIPLLGGAAKQKQVNDDKRNLMIFIRPQIIDTADEYVDLTRREQNIKIDRDKFKRPWNYEVDEALDFFNLKRNGPDDGWNCTNLE
jgi:type III secretion protein C